MEHPWPEAGRELERMAGHICEVLPETTRCVSYCPEGVQLRLFIPEYTVRIDIDHDPDKRITRIALESVRGGGRVDIDRLLDRLAVYTPLQASVEFTRQFMDPHMTVDINLKVANLSA